MPVNPSKQPSYRLHKATGLAVVTLNGRDVYLGPHGTTESRTAYDRAIAEWLACGRQPVQRGAITVNDLLLRYTNERFPQAAVDATAVKNWSAHVATMKPLRAMYGHTPASSFGPLALKSLRLQFIARGWGRKQINKRVQAVRRLFRWGVANELIPAGVSHALQAVEGLRRGQTNAPEGKPVKPVPQQFVDAVIPRVSRHVGAMIRLQELTGARPGEICLMRWADIDVTGKVWTYRPTDHKTAHLDKPRIVYIGPRAQAVLAGFKRLDTNARIFQPCEADAEIRRAKRAARKTPVQPSQMARTPKRNQQKCPGHTYTTDSYRRSIWYGCDAADRKARGLAGPWRCAECDSEYPGWGFLARHAKRVHDVVLQRPKPDGDRAIPRWNPHQLRHNFATRIRREHGIELSRILCGHSSAIVTELYAEADLNVAADVLLKLG